MFASVELSSYRDQHFKVSTSEGATADLRLNKPLAGLALRARAIAPRLVYTLRGKLELLHHRGADPRALLPLRRCSCDCDGPGQVQEDALRLLLRGVLCPIGGGGGHEVSHIHLSTLEKAAFFPAFVEVIRWGIIIS